MVLTLDNVTAAMDGKRLGKYEPSGLTTVGETVLSKAYALSGRDPQLEYQKEDLGKDLAASFPSLTLNECILAVKAGVAGEIGTAKTPSYAAVMQWVGAYDKSPMVADARRITAKRKTEAPKRLTPEQGLAMMRRTMPALARDRWNSVRANGAFNGNAIPHVSAQIYDWLGEEGILKCTPEQKNAASRKATSEVRQGSVWNVEHLESGKALIRSRAKHYALEIWMRDLHTSGGSLTLPDQVKRIYE